MNKAFPEEIREAVNRVCDERDADLLVYAGPLFRGDDGNFIKLCRHRVRRKNVVLFLSTPGGMADAAYRVSRCLQRSYRTYDADEESRGSYAIFVDTICKSAGTILALGADELILSQSAELGPIDVQLRKENEVGERLSGLTPLQALQTLELQARGTFKRMFRAMRFDRQLAFSTKLSAEMAAKLTTGLLGPIYGQIDPMRLGEIERSVKISAEYGERLAASNVNIKDGTIERLLTGYPSHDFVIDRREARDLFENVIKPSDDLELIASFFNPMIWKQLWEDDPLVFYLNPEPKERQHVTQPKTNSGKGRKGTRATNRKVQSASRAIARPRRRPEKSNSGDRAADQAR